MRFRLPRDVRLVMAVIAASFAVGMVFGAFKQAAEGPCVDGAQASPCAGDELACGNPKCDSP